MVLTMEKWNSYVYAQRVICENYHKLLMSIFKKLGFAPKRIQRMLYVFKGSISIYVSDRERKQFWQILCIELKSITASNKFSTKR